MAETPSSESGFLKQREIRAVTTGVGLGNESRRQTTLTVLDGMKTAVLVDLVNKSSENRKDERKKLKECVEVEPKPAKKR